MKFRYVSEIFDVLEKTSSRLEMTKILATLFNEATGHEINIISNFVLGMLRPMYKGTQFNFAEKNVISALASFLNMEKKEIQEHAKIIGDLGLIPTVFGWKPHDELTVTQVYKLLCEFEDISGKGAQEDKATRLISLFKSVSPIEAKYIIRIILGTLRLGFSDMTLIDAFSWMIAGNKSLRSEIERAYNMCVDIGLIGQILKDKGIAQLEQIHMTVGIPVRPAAAERMPSPAAVFEKLGPCVAQPKLDGFRLQIHLKKKGKESEIHFFSRNLIDMSSMFPDLVQSLEQLEVDTLICEGEAISYDADTGTFLPFQETVKRKRKHEIAHAAAEFPLQCFLFDLLYLNGKECVNLSHEVRRTILFELFRGFPNKTIQIIEEVAINSVIELEQYFILAVERGLEGLVVKKPQSIYQPGKRNFNWIKLKRHAEGELEDTIDCVILGYNQGTGKRVTFGIGAFLVGVFNPTKDVFQTIAKIGTGLTDEEWKDLKSKCDKIATLQMPKNVECVKELYPDKWVNPEIVVTVRADEITLSPLHTAGKTLERLGYALRFPRFVSYRFDKSANETTTIKEIQRLYDDQFKQK